MIEGARSLRYAVKLPVVGQLLGQLLLVLAVLTLVPLAASIVFHEYTFSWRFLAVISLLLIVAIPLSRLPSPRQVQTNEALSVVALTFIATPLVMAFPMHGAGLSFGDALFEAVSAVTTTGLSTVSDLSDKPRTFLFTRAWIQWYGGLGIAVLSVALLVEHGIVARQLAEPVGTENLVATARSHARRLLAVYCLLTLSGIIACWLVIGDGFLALTHVLASVSTGGFSPLQDSAAGISGWPGRFTLILFAAAGAVPLALYHRAYTGRWRDTVRDPELRTLLLACLVISSILALLLHRAAIVPPDQVIPQALFLGLSAQTTTGFSVLNPSALDDTGKLVVSMSMLIGGGLGSTSGGIKILRLLILLRLLQFIIQRTAMPSHAVLNPQLGGKVLNGGDLIRALLLIVLFVVVIFFSWLAFVIYGYQPIDALFEVTSAAGTVGLSTGITQTALPGPLKFVLSVDMLLGRLEIIALLVVLYPPTWFGRRKDR